MKVSKRLGSAGYLLAAWIFIWGAGSAKAQETAVEGYQPVELKHALEAVLPPELRPLLIKDPRVTFRVVVDAEGQATDWLAVEATHYELLEKAEARLAEAEFTPAMQDGEPASGKITVIVTFFDPEQRIWREGGGIAPMGGSVSDAVERRMYGLNPERFRYKETPVPELDASPEIVKTQLYRVHAPEEAAPRGKVLVEYYVDNAGRVRLPTILESDDDNLSMSVLLTLRDTQFRAPTKNGKPTYFRIRQPFHFD